MDKEVELSEQEQKRQDNLLTSAKRLNYISFVVAGIALSISTIDSFDAFIFPIGKFSIPKMQVNLLLYFLSVLLNTGSHIYFSMASKYAANDPRRVPFNWLALSLGDSYLATFIWFFLPIVFCSIGVAVSTGLFSAFQLSFVGFWVIASPRLFIRYVTLLKKHVDHRGGSATFSIYLLYLYRLTRHMLLCTYFLLSLLLPLENWAGLIKPLFYVLGFLFVVLFIVRLLSWLPFVYRKIDSFGVKRGFVSISSHYR